MKNNTVLNEEQRPVTAEEVLKATALLYFQEALVKQEYESCGELIAAAKQFGADQAEIDGVIGTYLLGGRPGGPGGAKQKKNRLQ